MSVWLPAELAETVRDRLPGVNVSAVLQEGLRALLGCRHERLACAACAAPIDRWRLVDEALGRFYQDLMWELQLLVRRVGTAEGAARVAQEVARRHQLSAVRETALPRPTRAEREAARDASRPRGERPPGPRRWLPLGIGAPGTLPAAAPAAADGAAGLAQVAQAGGALASGLGHEAVTPSR